MVLLKDHNKKQILIGNELIMEKVRINNFDCFFSERSNGDVVPEGYPYVYYARHGSDDWTIPLTIEKFVRVDYFGTIFTKQPIAFGEKGFLDVWRFFRYKELDDNK